MSGVSKQNSFSGYIPSHHSVLSIITRSIYKFHSPSPKLPPVIMSDRTSAPSSSPVTHNDLMRQIEILRAQVGDSPEANTQFRHLIAAIVNAPRSQLVRLNQVFPGSVEVDVQFEALIDAQIKQTLALSTAAAQEVTNMQEGLVNELRQLLAMADSTSISDVEIGTSTTRVTKALSVLARAVTDLERQLQLMDEKRIL